MSLKPIYTKILFITGKILFLAYALVSMAFVNNKFKKKKIENITIKIISDNQPTMCNTEDIEKYIHCEQLLNKSYYEMNFFLLEKISNEKNEIKKSAIYFTPHNQLYIQVTERKPIARIISNYINHYIDDEWKTMKVTTPYKVPLIISEFQENPDLFRHYPISKIAYSSHLRYTSAFYDIHTVLNIILSDTILTNFIDYLYIHKNHEISLHPVIGKFHISAGNSENFQGKMNKLKLFIMHGLNKTNGWNKYSEINLQYKNLIYCTKK